MAKGIKNKGMKKALWLTCFVLATVVVVSAVNRTIDSGLDKVRFDIQNLEGGKSFLTPDDIKQDLIAAFKFGKSGLTVKQVGASKLEEAISKNPYIQQADVYIDAKDRITVKVTQREPYARIIDNSGNDYYLTKDGYRLPLSTKYVFRIPVITGNIPAFKPADVKNDSTQMYGIVAIVNDIQNDPLMSAMVEQIYIDDMGDIELIPKIGDHKIIIGEYKDIKDKFKKLKIFYVQGLSQEGWNKYKTINLKFKDQVVCQINPKNKA